MSGEKSASVIITITQEQKNALKRIAAQNNLKNLDNNETVTLSSLGRQAITEFLERENNGFTVPKKTYYFE